MTTLRTPEMVERLNADGHVVIENLIPKSMAADLRDRVERILERERAHPADPGDSDISVDQVADLDFTLWRMGDDEIERLKRRIRRRQLDEFDTPWPVPADEVCISFIHIPSLFDDGRSQRIFNLINKDVAFAPLVEHPLVLSVIEQELGRDLIVLDMSLNHVGPHTNSAGWHVDSPLTQIAEPLPNFTLSIQTAWMLDDFSIDNGATHVATGSNHTQRKPPRGQEAARQRDRARRAGRLRGDVVVADLASSWRQRDRRCAQRCDHPVRPIVGEAVRRSAHADRRRAGGGLLAPPALHARLQRQRPRARLSQLNQPLMNVDVSQVLLL